MQWKGERLALKTLGPQRKSCNALGTTRSTLFAEMFLGEKFVCIITAKAERCRLGRKTRFARDGKNRVGFDFMPRCRSDVAAGVAAGRVWCTISNPHSAETCGDAEALRPLGFLSCYAGPRAPAQHSG